MKSLKVMTILGTRPEIIKLSEVIKACDIVFDHILVHTGQNWDFNLNDVFFQDLSIRYPDYYLNAPGKNLGETIGNIICSSYELMSKQKPDAVLILGDTNSALSAISAKRLKIPIFHMEAGNRCFDENVPEEINRRIVDHTADVNLAYTEHARLNLIREGIPAQYLFVTGTPLAEVLNNSLSDIIHSSILSTLKLTEKKYMVVSIHREENTDDPTSFASLMNALNDIADNYKLPMIFSTHPRTQKHLDDSSITLNPLIKNIPPLSYTDYNQLQRLSYCVLSDSGSLAEEASLLRFPAVSLRTSTERPEAFDKGSITLGNITSEAILRAIQTVNSIYALDTPMVSDYKDVNVSSKVVNIIQSYTPVITDRVWHKK